MFIDTANVFIKSGHGGRGCLSFHREKYMPKGGPDGGDGGKGGSVIFIGDSGLNTLSKFRYSPKLIAENGQPGEGNQCSGKKGKDCKVTVPCGTLVRNAQTGELICDILAHDEEVVVAEGGDGGRGNQHFATARNQSPHRTEPGWPGVGFKAVLELKVMADVGLVGFPNAGKSSLLAAVSKAHPKIADYAFTTLHPNLGVINMSDYRSIVMADIPGLIEHASEGKGLGIQFLKHVERTRVLLFVIDVSFYASVPPGDAYRILSKEIHEFGHDIEGKNKLIAANKMDLDPDKTQLKDFLSQLPDRERKNVFPISAATKQGLKPLIQALDKLLFAVPE
ncbi:MAG: GTPase ObgE [Candidatus Aureabacteria bacterium]|nr:GTPase ObgE [Candidatus Auribacterota bacterium]